VVVVEDALEHGKAAWLPLGLNVQVQELHGEKSSTVTGIMLMWICHGARVSLVCLLPI
jgi:hypothetical protein